MELAHNIYEKQDCQIPSPMAFYIKLEIPWIRIQNSKEDC